MECSEANDRGGQRDSVALRGLRVRRVRLAVPAALSSTTAPALAQSALPSMDPSTTVLVAVLLVMLVGLAAAVFWLARRQRDCTRRLHQTQLQLHHLGSLLDVWLWRSDLQHRIVRIRPPAGAALTAWSQHSVGRMLWEQFSTDADSEAALRAQLDAHAPLDGLVVQITSDSGDARTARLRAAAMTNAQGHFDGYLGIVREIAHAPAVAGTSDTTVSSEAPKAVQALAEARSGVPAEGPVDESFTYTISHDLRAPIRVIEGFTRILKEDYGHVLDRIGNDHLERVLGAAGRMSGMIDALLGLSQLSAKPLEREPVNLSQLAAYVTEDLRRLSPLRQVSVHIDADMQVQGDPTLLRMVLENLLGNAWKYTGKRADAQIWFERSGPDTPTVFTVRDNGAGFDMRFADRLFGAFQRLHSASEFQGTGVGLVSVRRIVRRHGGEIWAESEPGKGARFHFTLAPGRGKR